MIIKRNLRNIFSSLVLPLCLMFTVGCGLFGGDDDDDEDDDNAVSSNPYYTGSGSGSDSDAVPNMTAINLTGLALEDGSSLALEEEDCAQSDLGIFGLALGGACHTHDIAQGFLLGDNPDSNGDGDVDCDDLGDESGLMIHLMCEDVLRQKAGVHTIAFEESDGTFGVSFGQVDGIGVTTAEGAWTQGSPTNFPANISIFQGDSMAALSGMGAAGLNSMDDGVVYFNFSEGDMDIDGKVIFDNADNTDDCEDDPNDENCHTQEIFIYAGEGEVQGPPNGFHIKVWANDKNDPDFIAIEGKYRYSEDGAAASFSDAPSVMTDVRGIYFTVVQKGDQLWGRFYFRDADEDLLVLDQGDGDVFESLSANAGICTNLGDDSFVTCVDISRSDYNSLWSGEDDFADVTSSLFDDITLPAAPQTVGICSASGCDSL